jgi:hypothetical protein
VLSQRRLSARSIQVITVVLGLVPAGVGKRVVFASQTGHVIRQQLLCSVLLTTLPTRVLAAPTRACNLRRSDWHSTERGAQIPARWWWNTTREASLPCPPLYAESLRQIRRCSMHALTACFEYLLATLPGRPDPLLRRPSPRRHPCRHAHRRRVLAARLLCVGQAVAPALGSLTTSTRRRRRARRERLQVEHPSW